MNNNNNNYDNNMDYDYNNNYNYNNNNQNRLIGNNNIRKNNFNNQDNVNTNTNINRNNYNNTYNTYTHDFQLGYNNTNNNNNNYYINNNNNNNRMEIEHGNGNNNNAIYVNIGSKDNNIESDDSSCDTSIKNIRRFSSNIKDNVMNRFRHSIYIFPLILLILFGIVFFLNEQNEYLERRNIIIIFSIIMGVIILLNCYLYYAKKRKYKNMAKKDGKELIKKLREQNIENNNLGDKTLFINRFINERIKENGITVDEYKKYVFPEFKKYLKKKGGIYMNTIPSV